MRVRKIRIIDTKGNARFVMPHIANDSKLMSSYGFKIEDPSLKKEGEEIGETLIEDPSLKKEDTEPKKRGPKPKIKQE